MTSKLSSKQRIALSNIVGGIARSSRFPLIKDLPVEQFLKGAGIKLLSKRTLEELVTLSQAEVSPLFALSDIEAKSLVKALKPLIDKEEQVPSSPSPSAEVTHINSVKAAQLLMGAAEKLKSSPHFGKLQGKTLGDYWPPEGPSAPFEKEMTFKQFTSLDMDTLLKKRSFGGEKIMAVVSAVDAALSTTGSALPESQGQDEAPFEWRTSVPLTSDEDAWCLALLALIDRLPQGSASHRLLAATPRGLTPKEWCELNKKKVSKQGKSKVHTLIRNAAPEVARFWESKGTTKASQAIAPYLVTEHALEAAALEILFRAQKS